MSEGSGYRLPGVRMLILENGDTFGTVSGGCLELTCSNAEKVLKSRRAEVFTYDTTADENSVFSLNMGCRGVIRILLERIGPDSELARLIASVTNKREKYSVATYIGGDIKTGLDVGTRLFVGSDGVLSAGAKSCVTAVPGIDDDLLTFHESDGAYETMRYVTGAGETEFAFETLSPPVLVAIFGSRSRCGSVGKVRLRSRLAGRRCGPPAGIRDTWAISRGSPVDRRRSRQ